MTNVDVLIGNVAELIPVFGIAALVVGGVFLIASVCLFAFVLRIIQKVNRRIR